jgi:hypothetical protein
MKSMLLLYLILPALMTYGQCTFRIRPVRVENGTSPNFILPPRAKIAGQGIFGCRKLLTYRLKSRSRFKYQYCIFSHLRSSDPYYTLLDKIGKAEYFFSSDDATIFLEQKYTIYDGGTLTPGKAARVFYSNDSSTVAIEIENDVVMSGDPVKNFNQLAIELLTLLAHASPGDWPNAGDIAQQMMTTLFGLIAHPQVSDLAGWGYTGSVDKSFVLMDPQFVLDVDSEALKNLRPDMLGTWNYNFYKGTPIRFYRNENGVLKQKALVHFEKNANELPNNKVGNTEVKNTLLASSADLQLSLSTKNLRYIAWYQDFSKRDNQTDNQTSSMGVANGLINRDDDVFIGNSMLLLSDDLGLLLNHPTDPSIVRAAFGNGGLLTSQNAAALRGQFARRTITPLIHFWWNGENRWEPLGTTLDILNQESRLPDGFRIERMYRGRYRKLRYATPTTFLLPEDKIIY